MKENIAGTTKERPPIVVVMGHVDHGKTTLLDYIRKTNVAGREAGGITQSIGAYEITHPSTSSGQAKKITFIDTPGHEAFTAMRSRGAAIADLAILVIAADEGMKPQTKEAIEILVKSETPFIVAINKIDKTNGDVEKAKNELTGAGVLLEGYGGQTSWHGVSAKTGEGTNELLDLIVLSAEIEHLTYDPQAPATGYVLETRVDRQRGSEATMIVKNGILKRGDEIRTETASGKVKILENFLGKTVDSLEPSAPALVIGFETLPRVGEAFSVGSVPDVGQKVAARPSEPRRPAVLPKQDDKPVLNLILKASDAGSLEVLSLIVKSLGTERRPLTILDESVGEVGDNDARLSITSGAVIIGFRSKLDKGAKNLAEAHGVRIITSEIIYDLVKAVEEFLGTLEKPPAIGELEVLAIFNQAKPEKQLVGGRVVDGIVKNKGTFEIVRGVVGGNGAQSELKAVGSGKILNLRDKKSDVVQAEKGKEAGLQVNSAVLIKAGDRLVIRK